MSRNDIIKELSVTPKEKSVTVKNHKGKIQLDFYFEKKRYRPVFDLPYNKDSIKVAKEKIYPKLLNEIIESKNKKTAKTFEYYYDFFLESKSKQKSYSQKLYIYNKVNEFFKSKNVDEITRLEVKRYIKNLSIKKRSKGDYLTCIRGTLDCAIDDAVISNNVAIGIKVDDDSEPKDVRIYSTSEIELLLSNADGMLKNFLGIAFNTGMRAGEILALKQVDIKDTFIDVKKSLSKGKVTTPKTNGSIREVPILSDTLQYIDDQKNTKSLYLFCDEEGKHLKGIDDLRTDWSKLLEKCKMAHSQMKNTRHTFITHMLDSGKFKVSEIAKIVGHVSPRMILTVYSGFIKSEKIKVDNDFSLYSQHMDNSKKEDMKEKC